MSDLHFRCDRTLHFCKYEKRPSAPSFWLKPKSSLLKGGRGVLPKKTTPRLWKSMERCPCQRGFTDASHMHRLCSTLVEGGFERVNVRNNFFLNLPQSVCISSENRQKPIKYHFLKSSLLLFNPFGPEFPREWQFFHRSLWYVFKNPFKFLQIGRQEVDNCIRLEEY